MNTNTTLELLIDGRSLRISPDLLRNYNQPAPRYTSYPTAPEWDEGFRETDLRQAFQQANRSEEHTSELQSRFDLVCRLLLEKKKNNTNKQPDRQTIAHTAVLHA